MRALGLVAATVLLGATACGGSGTDSPGPRQEPVTTSAAPADDPTEEPTEAPTEKPTEEPTVEVFTMPRLVGENLQDAQDRLQALGSYILEQDDATGQGRSQYLDSRWTVCTQEPAAGRRVSSDTRVVLASVKLDEDCP